MATAFQLFLYTVDEYNRFAKQLPVKKIDHTESYSEADYVGIQMRLMLLRKYYSTSKHEKVCLKNLLAEAKSTFPSEATQFDALLDRYNSLEEQNIEHLLADGTKLNLYETIEDAVYGLYLHADESRIAHLHNTTEGMRYYCTQIYILEVEAIVNDLYTLLLKCGVMPLECSDPQFSPMVYLGDPSHNAQAISGSPYWKNIYGTDASDDDLRSIVNGMPREEQEILLRCMNFVTELLEEPMQKCKLRKHIHPMARADWGDFSAVQKRIADMPNLGFSTKVRFNEAKDTAYVRIFPKVDEAFLLSTPHILTEIQEFTLGKWFGKWMIYSFGGHLDSIYVKK